MENNNQVLKATTKSTDELLEQNYFMITEIANELLRNTINSRTNRISQQTLDATNLAIKYAGLIGSKVSNIN